MKVITVEGRDYRISERDLKQMLKMFNTDKASPAFSGYYYISARSICAGRSHKCVNCSFYDPGKRVYGCIHVFRKILGEQDFNRIYFLDQGIFWESAFDKQARLAINRVSDLLLGARDASDYEICDT